MYWTPNVILDYGGFVVNPLAKPQDGKALVITRGSDDDGFYARLEEIGAGSEFAFTLSGVSGGGYEDGIISIRKGTHKNGFRINFSSVTDTQELTVMRRVYQGRELLEEVAIRGDKSVDASLFPFYIYQFWSSFPGVKSDQKK